MKISSYQKLVLQKLAAKVPCWAKQTLAYDLNRIIGLSHYKFRTADSEDTVGFTTIWSLRKKGLIETKDVIYKMKIYKGSLTLAKSVVSLTKLGKKYAEIAK